MLSPFKNFALVINIFIISTICSTINAQTINGYINDSKTGEALIGATIYQAEENIATLSNDYGYFSLKINPNSDNIIISFIGYENDTISTVESKENINIALSPKSIHLQEFEVNTNKSQQLVESNQYAPRSLDIASIEKMPMVLGEADIIKAVQLQSGVKTLGDGSAGMFIRGGADDQNLILIDEAPIYNPSHLLGLISVFNPDAVNNVSFYKSNMPAEYGGRSSAVLDCKMKEGNSQSHHFSVGLSTLCASLFANGPIVKDKASYLLSVRHSTFGKLFTSMMTSSDIEPAFYDINFKANTKIGEKDRLYFSFYNGRDKTKSDDSYHNQWSNTVATLRWNRAIGQKWYSNLSLIGSSYENELEYNKDLEENDNYNWETGVKDINLKYDISNYISANSQLKFGANVIYHQLTPGRSNQLSNSIPSSDALELGLFAQHDISLWDKVGINYGLRFSSFQNIGKTEWYEYNDDRTVITHKNDGGVFHTENQLEPRVNISYKAGTGKSLKLAYARNTQYMQVLNNNSLAYTSLETWFPSNPNIKPLLSDVVSLGWFQQITPSYFVSAEIYYKNINNIIDYIGHAQLTDNPYVERETRSGKGKAYGAEIEFSKQTGRLTGTVSYSYSRALQTIDEINNGNEYSSLYDIPHDIKINANYALGKRWSLSAFWTYNTGRPTTVPIGISMEDYQPFPIYTDRNAARFPDYHRLDISANYTTKPKEKKYYWDLGLGIYNVYNRENPIGYIVSGTNLDPISFLGFLPNFSVKFTY